MKNKIKQKIGIAFVLAMITANFISAFAVSSEFWEQNPLKMYPGEEREITIDLQNMAGTENIESIGVISEGNEIAEIQGKEFLVPVGERIPITLEVDIPKEAVVGEKYTIKLLFNTKPEQEGGNIGFASSIEKVIPVTVIGKVVEPQAEEAKEKSNVIIGLIIGVIALAVIITILIARKKKEK